VKRVALFVLAAVLLLVAVAWLTLRSLSSGELGGVLRERVSDALGREVTWDSLEGDLLPPRMRVTALKVGDPILVSAGDVELHLEVAASVRERRLRVAARVTRLYANASGPDDAPAETAEASAPLFTPPMALRVEIDEASADLSEGRSVAARQVTADLEVGPRQGRGVRLSVMGLELVRRDNTTRVEEAVLVAELRDGMLAIERVDMGGPDVVIAARSVDDRGIAALRSGIAPTAIHAEGEIGPIIEFWAGEIDLSGAATFDGTVHGPIADPLLAGAVRVESANLFGAEFSTLIFDVHRETGRWEASDVAATWPAGRLVGDLALNESNWALTGSAGWRDVDVAALSGVGSRWNAQSSGDVSVTVTFVDFALALSGAGRIEADGTEAVPFDVALSTDGERWSGSAEMVIDAGHRLQIRVDRADSAGLAAEVVAEAASIERVAAVLGYEGSLPMRGGLAGRASCSGTTAQPQCVVDLTGAHLRLADGTSAALRSRVTVTRGEMSIDALELAVGAGRITTAGTVALAAGRSNDWTLRVDAVELAPIMDVLRQTVASGAPPAAGVINGSLAVRGEWKDAQATGRFTVDGSAVNGVELGSVGIDVVSVAGDWRVAGDAGGGDRSERGSIEVRGSGDRVGAVTARVDNWPIASLVGAADADIDGRLDLVANVEAIAVGARGRIDLGLTDLSVGDHPVADSQLRAIGESGAWRVDGQLLGGAAVLDATVDEGGAAPFVARVQWRDAIVPAGLTAGDKLRISSTGEITATGRLVDIAAARVAMSVEALEIASGRERLSNEGLIRLERDGAGLRLVSLVLAGGETRLSATGAVHSDGNLRLVANGTIDLRWLEHLTTAVEAATGTAELAIEIAGASAAGLQLSGSAAIRDGVFELTGLPPATGVRGNLVLSSSQVAVPSFSGKVGGGRFSVTGLVDVIEGPNLEWSVHEVSLEPADRLEMVLTGSGTLSGPWDETLLGGEVAIADLLYDRDLAFQDLIPSFDRAVAPAPARRDARPPLRLNIRVTARDGMYVTNNIADLEARTDLKVTGSVRRPRLRGALEVIDGRILLRGRSFEIVTGVLTFQPEMRGKAQIDFLAESIIESGDVPYGVQVRVNGTTDDYRVTLDSEDGLSQTDIASLITFGKTVSEMQEGAGAGGGFSVDGLAGIAGGQVGKVLAGEIREVLPFDVVEVRPGFSPSTGEFEPQIRLGKHITEDLSAWIAQTFGVRSQTAVEVSYALTRQIATTLRWESQTASQEGAFGGEVSQRFEFWGLPSWLEWGTARAVPGGAD
jgi:hypothetical protein